MYIIINIVILVNILIYFFININFNIEEAGIWYDRILCVKRIVVFFDRV